MAQKNSTINGVPLLSHFGRDAGTPRVSHLSHWKIQWRQDVGHIAGRGPGVGQAGQAGQNVGQHAGLQTVKKEINPAGRSIAP
jgi:hypothetical protein